MGKECAEHEYFSLDRRQLTTVPAQNFRQLAAYCQDQQVKRHLLLEIAARLPMDRATKVVELFEHIDKDRSGSVSPKDLRAYFQEMGIEDEQVINDTFKALDVDQDGLLSFSEFAAGALLLFKDLMEERLAEIFERYDHSDNGALEEDEAKDFLEDVFAAIDRGNGSGSMRRQSAIDELLKNCPRTGKGVTYDQLRQYVLGDAATAPRPESTGK